MPTLSFTECFAKYGAKLTDPMWAVSAQAADGSIVIGCWANHFRRPDRDAVRYDPKFLVESEAEAIIPVRAVGTDQG
jgi:uncharacterized protein YbaA (DUF1428 family)